MTPAGVPHLFNLGAKVAAAGPSGVVLTDGQNIQYTRKKRSTFGMIHGAQVGAGQLMTPAGVPHLFNLGAKVAAAGPSGVVLTDGQNIQYTRKKRSTFGMIHGAQVGAGQLMTPAGVPHLFALGTKVAAAGPSGVVLTDGQNIQYARKKRSTFGMIHGAQVGAGQLMTPAGVPHLFNLGAKVAAAGPSGVVLTDGQNIQYTRKKRSTAVVGASGVITPSGAQYQLPHGVDVVVAGPSGVVRSDGNNIQY